MEPYTKKNDKEEKERREYMNRMKRTLNTRVQDSIFPNWRCHPSLNGWSSMNYPSILTNKKDLLKPRKPDVNPQFSNLHRPITSPPIQRKRPISTEVEGRAAKLAVDPNYAEQLANKIGKQHALQTIKEYKQVMEENKRLKSGDKLSAGTLSTYTYEEKKQVVEQLNKKVENYAPLRPLSSFLGPKVDPLNCRKVKQLDDIEFDDDESNEDEDTYMYKRLPRTNITESTLKNYLTPALEGLNIERHDWIRNDFINKMSYVAPNLADVGLRGLEDVTDETIGSITRECKSLQSLDISLCSKLTEASGKYIGENCEKLKTLKAAYCEKVITDATLKKIAAGCKLLNYLDMSYCKAVTDEGLEALVQGKNSFVGLFINGFTNVTALGVVGLIRNSYTTLEQLEMSLLDPAKFDDSICSYLCKCDKLKILDLTGLNTITDDGLSSFFLTEKGIEQGVTNLLHLRLNGLDKIKDENTAKFCCRNRKLENLELCKCAGLTVAGIDLIVRGLNCLSRININMIPGIKMEALKEAMELKPNLQIIQFATKNVDPRDNGLRVPLPPKKKKKKVKKGKKSKK